MYWSACSSTCSSSSASDSDRGHLDDLGDGGVAADRDRAFLAARAGALHGAANRFADGLDIDDGLFVDRVGRRRLGRIRLDAILTAGLDQLDELDRRRGYVKADQRTSPRAQRNLGQLQHNCFLFRSSACVAYALRRVNFAGQLYSKQLLN